MKLFLFGLAKTFFMSKPVRLVAIKVVFDLLYMLAQRSETNFDDEAVARIESDLRKLGYIK